jgi:hypothetical protein
MCNLKKGQVVVYFWKRTTAAGGAEGYSIGEAEEAKGGKEGSDRTTAKRQVRVFINYDYAPRMKTLIPPRSNTSGRNRIIRVYETP